MVVIVINWVCYIVVKKIVFVIFVVVAAVVVECSQIRFSEFKSILNYIMYVSAALTAHNVMLFHFMIN